MLLQLAGQLVGGRSTIPQDDDRADHGPALGVGGGDRRGLCDGRMGDERRLDLEGADPVAGGEDQVVAPPLEPEVAVLVLRTRSPVGHHSPSKRSPSR